MDAGARGGTLPVVPRGHRPARAEGAPLLLFVPRATSGAASNIHAPPAKEAIRIRRKRHRNERPIRLGVHAHAMVTDIEALDIAGSILRNL